MKGTEMAEQRNLTQENVEEVKRIFKQMQEEVPDLEYWFFPPKQETKSDTLEMITITKEIIEKLVDSLEQESEPKFDFDGHVLLDGFLGRHLARKWKLRI